MSRSPNRSRRASGFTILELMIVMLLIGIFLGLGAGVYLGLGDSLRFRTAVGRVKTLVRKTRNFSVSGGGPAVVHVDREQRLLRGSGNQPVGMWHFEDARGAFGRDAEIQGGEIVPDGRFGKGVRLRGAGYVDLGRSPEYDDREGILVETWVRPDESGRFVFLEKGRAFRLGTDTEGRLEGRIAVGIGDDVTLVASADEGIPAGRWTRVGLLYDRYRFQLVRDGRAVATEAESRPLRPDRRAPLTLGSPRASFTGTLDEARIFRMVPGEDYVLPEGMQLDESGPKMLVFRTGGALDPEVHRGPVTLRLLSGERSDEITVGVLGMIL